MSDHNHPNKGKILTPEEIELLRRTCDICFNTLLEMLMNGSPMILYPSKCDKDGKGVCITCRSRMLNEDTDCECPYGCKRSMAECTKIPRIEFRIESLPPVQDLTKQSPAKRPKTESDNARVEAGAGLQPGQGAWGGGSQGANPEAGAGPGGVAPARAAARGGRVVVPILPGQGPTGPGQSNSTFRMANCSPDARRLLNLCEIMSNEEKTEFRLFDTRSKVFYKIPENPVDTSVCQQIRAKYAFLFRANFFEHISPHKFVTTVSDLHKTNTHYIPDYFKTVAVLMENFAEMVNDMAKQCKQNSDAQKCCRKLAQCANNFSGQYKEHYCQIERDIKTAKG